jgi:hypothetical protein
MVNELNGRWIDGIKRRISSTIAIVGSLMGIVAPASAQTLGNAKLKTRMTQMGSWFLSYGRTLPPYQMNLLVVPNEGCLLEIQNMLGDSPPERPEIGVYFWKNPPADAESLRQLMLNAEAEHNAQPKVPSRPGTRYIIFGLGKHDGEGKEQVTVVSRSQPLTPAVVAFDKAALAMAHKAFDHPHMALRAKGIMHSKEVAPDGEIEGRLELTNIGTVPLIAFNPATPDSLARVTLLIEDRLQGFQSVDANPSELAASTGPAGATQLGPTTAAQIKLAPGDVLALSIRIRRHLYLDKGRSAVTLRYTSSRHGIDENEGLEGFVQVLSGSIEPHEAAAKTKGNRK